MIVLPGMSALGVRFNIDDVETVYDTASYGTACWQVFWEAVDIRTLGTALLFEGDTHATLSSGSEYVYCICVQSMDTAAVVRVRAALESSETFKKVAATPPFVEGAALNGEPLPEAGKVTERGELIGDAWNAREGLQRAQKP